MLTLASLVWAVYFFCVDITQMHNVPMPVVVEHGTSYYYREIDAAAYIPTMYTDTCANQHQVVRLMLEHFNSFRNGQQKYSGKKLYELSQNWVCVK